jgi:hypothetical protein
MNGKPSPTSAAYNAFPPAAFIFAQRARAAAAIFTFTARIILRWRGVGLLILLFSPWLLQSNAADYQRSVAAAARRAVKGCSPSGQYHGLPFSRSLIQISWENSIFSKLPVCKCLQLVLL